jgi:hypothetical protein
MMPKGAYGLIYESNNLPERDSSQVYVALLMSPDDNSELISKAKCVKHSAFISQLERHPPLALDFVLLASGVWLRASPVTPPHQPATESQRHLLDELAYRRAFQYMSFKRWRTTGEPYEPTFQEPELFLGAINALLKHKKKTLAQLCAEVGISQKVFSEITGIQGQDTAQLGNLLAFPVSASTRSD